MADMQSRSKVALSGSRPLSEKLADRSDWFRDDAEVRPASEIRHAAEDCIVHW
jgi:hypothetical protein